MMVKQVDYVCHEDGQELDDGEARSDLHAMGACKVIKHKVETSVQYLVEYENGERVWVLERK